MKILVTGGAGFIGSHIVDKYIALGHKVVVVDNLSTGFRENLNPKAKFYNVDIRDGKKISQIFKKEKPQIVNHHAALASVILSVKEPLVIQEVNLLGTVNLLLAAGQNYVKKFIFASTGGAMYGEKSKIPANESTPNPISPYGLSKLYAEQAVKFYADDFKMDYTILRYANVYGPRQNPKGEAGVVAIFSRLMKQGQRPTIFGDGSKTRDYIFVADLASANVLALKHGRRETLNLGLGKEISDQQVFDAIAQATKFKGKPNYAPRRTGELTRSALDARRAKRVLKWKPKISFKEGIAATVLHY